MKITGLVLAVLIVCVFMGPAKSAGAETIDIVHSITVSSQYWDHVTASWGKDTTWIFSRAAGSRTGGYNLEVRPEEAADEPTAVLSYDGNGALREVNRFLKGAGRTRSVADSFTDKVVLSEGFPVPYDFLSPWEAHPKKLTVKRKAGGMVFSSEVERALQDCSLSDALREGWLSEPMQAQVKGKRLQWIEVKKDGALVVRQLWPEGFSWWIYEETPWRRSWLQRLE